MTRTVFEVVPARIEDAEGIAAVHIAGWRETYGHLLPESYYDLAAKQRSFDHWSKVITSSNVNGVLEVAHVAGEVVGFAAAGPTRESNSIRPTELYSIYVLSSWHGTGVAAALLDASLGEKSAQLWVEKGNRRATGFYAKHGFILDSEEKIDDRFDGLVEVRMYR